MDASTFMGMEQLGPRTWQLEVTERVATPGNFLYGGCGLGSALVAMEAAAGRPTIWATAQYLGFAPLGAIVRVEVDVAVEGRRTTQARATMWDGDREVLTVNAALGRSESAVRGVWAEAPEVPGPATCPPRRVPDLLRASIFNHMDTRVALGRTFEALDGTAGDSRSATWCRVPGHLDPSAATLAIFGDLLSGASSQAVGRRLMGRSLDNTLRVVQLEPTEWVLCDMHLHALVAGYAQGVAFLWSEHGTLLGTASQSVAVREWRE